MLSELKANTRIRLKGDPTRIGILTERTQPGRLGQGLRYQVMFPDNSQWIPEDQIELVPTEQESPVELLRQGKLGRATDMRRTITHVRVTGRLVDVIYSMETTNTEFYSYQFKPVLRFLQSPSNALLIADEVGLGKTIEAGLVWTELRSRFDMRRLLVLCPAMLRPKWQRELAQKMGVRADIVKADDLHKRLKSPESSIHGYALICSQEGARPTRDWEDEKNSNSAAKLARFLRDRENDPPLIDLLIVDEAHYMRNRESRTNELGHLLRRVTENLLLLTATPIHNYNEDLFSLLNLLDADIFERSDSLKAILEANRPLVESRDHLLSANPSVEKLDEALRRAEGNRLLQGNRQITAIREALREPDCLKNREKRAEMAYRMELVNPLAYVITRTRKRDVKEWRVIREPTPEAVRMTEAEEAFYNAVTELVIDHASISDVNELFILATPQRQMSSSMAASLRAWRKRMDNVDETATAGSEDENEEIGPLTRKIIEQVDKLGNYLELMRHDSKYNRLRDVLNHFFKDHPAEKVVLFSTFRETLNYLGERLSNDGIRNLVMHGKSIRPKEEILTQFRVDQDVRILLSSEVGSEGIDLQFCHVLVNYDLPWNPMRIEQRIGRLDRLGQNAEKILIWSLFYKETIDDRIYTRLYEKLNLIQQALGDFEVVLGDEIRKLSKELLSCHLTPKQEEDRIDQTAQALANLRHDEELLENEASHLVAYGDYILNQVHAARDMNRRIIGYELTRYVIDFVQSHYPGCVFRQSDDDAAHFDVSLSPSAKQALEDFIRFKRLMPTSLTQNSNRPIPCRFENRTNLDGMYTVELINQFHPLVRFVSDQIDKSDEQLTPAVSIQLNCEMLADLPISSGDYVLAIARWSVTGLQSSEKLAYAGARIFDSDVLETETAERLANYAVQYGEDWFEAHHHINLDSVSKIADNLLFGELDAKFNDYVNDIRRRNEDRADLQVHNLNRHHDNQRRKLEDIRLKHLTNNRRSLVKATDGRIEALLNRIKRQEQAIESRRSINYRSDEIAIALIRVV